MCTFVFGDIGAPQADSAYDAFYDVYWNSSNNTFYKTDTEQELLDFWRYAHTWETMMDIYERTGDTTYIRHMYEAWEGFLDRNYTGTDWTRNEFNDDIAWWTLASTRAFFLTGYTIFSHMAKKHYDWVYDNECDDVLGGGVWWKNSSNESKNACINGQMICTEMNIYWIFNDEEYLNEAIEICNWIRETLYNSNG